MIIVHSFRPQSPPYASIAESLLRIATSLTLTDTCKPFAAGKSSYPAAMESEMETTDADQQDDPLLLNICHHLQKAGIGFRQWAASVADDEIAHAWALTREQELLTLADYINPPKPCWPANVVPFVPRRTG